MSEGDTFMLDRTHSSQAPQPTKIKDAATISWFQQAVHRSRTEKMFSEVKTVTPAMAEIILNNNPDNRRIRPIKLAQMVSDMRAGRWTLNGEAIIVAKTGELNDGQHRLNAVIEAKVPVPLLFVFGADRESRTTVDQGANRTAGDYLSMDGVTNAHTLTSIARTVMSYERMKGAAIGRISELTPAEIIDRVKADRTLLTSAKWADNRKGKMKRYATGTVLGFCHNILLREDASDGLAFMEQLCTGEDLKRGDAVYTARERLLSMDKGKTTASMVEVILRAWNGYRDRRPMRTIPIHGRLPELA